MRIHVPSLPHTETIRSYCWCAYTEKVRKFCNMMHDSGHEVYLYAGTRNEARCTEHIEVLNDEERERWFGHYDWNHDVFDGFDVRADWWQIMNNRVINAIKERAKEHDALGIIAGLCQKPLADALPNMHHVEWGVGYPGVFASFRVFESYAWMHYSYGRDCMDGRFYDAVIPNAVDPTDFEVNTGDPDDYLLFIGRHTARKGLGVVEEVAKHHKVITAGQGDPIPGTEYRGVVKGKERAELMANARAVLVPTAYVEPFGGVAVEAMISGTPVITTDWGAFTETVDHGNTGFRCRTLGEFLGAIDRLQYLDRMAIHAYAMSRFSTAAVALDYDTYFEQLGELWKDGWYTSTGVLRDTVEVRYQR